MGAVVIGPWDGAYAKTEHRDEKADKFRRWAEHFEGLLQNHDGERVPLPRDSAEAMAKYLRSREDARLAQLDQMRPMESARLQSRIRRLESQLETRDRGWDKYWKLRDQLKRERKGTPLDTLDLDPKTRGHLWAADIVTVEELVRHIGRPNWLIRGVGPKRRAEIIAACARAPSTR